MPLCLTRVFVKEDTVYVTDETVETPAPEEASNVDLLTDAAPAERPYTPAEGLDPEAPYGWTIDRKTGTKRPRKRAGRGVRVVKVEEPAAEAPRQPDREPDRVPGRVTPEVKRTRTRARRERAERVESEPMPPFRAGPIAKGMNKLYLRAGKILKAMDRDLGIAVIEMTKAEYDEEQNRVEGDLTVGEAWEAVAQVNPRIRRVLLRFIEGGAWGALFWAHVPLLMAIMMKERVARRIPFARLAAAFLNDDDAGDDAQAPGMGGLLAGLTQEDMQQAAAMFSQFMPGAASAMPPGMAGYATVRDRNGVRPATVEDLGFGDADA